MDKDLEMFVEFIPGTCKDQGTCVVSGHKGSVTQFYIKADDKGACDIIAGMFGVEPEYDVITGTRCLVLGACDPFIRFIGDIKEAVKLNNGRISAQIIEGVKAKHNKF